MYDVLGVKILHWLLKPHQNEKGKINHGKNELSFWIFWFETSKSLDLEMKKRLINIAIVSICIMGIEIRIYNYIIK